MNILVVEDDPPTQVLLGVLFRPLNVLVDSASDGTEALRLLRKKSYDAVVLDLLLPRVNGFDLLREMKSHAPELLGRTVVITACSQETLRNFSDQSLVRRVLLKPFDIDELTREVLACCPPDAPRSEAAE